MAFYESLSGKVVSIRFRCNRKRGCDRHDGACLYEISNHKSVTMAVEIRELVIKAVIVDDQSGEQEASTAPDSQKDKEQIIQECVNQVLRILNKQKNR